MNDNKTYRKSLFILSTIAVGLNLLMFIPFGKSFGSAEVLVKFILLPIVVAALNIIITLKNLVNIVQQIDFNLLQVIYLFFLI